MNPMDQRIAVPIDDPNADTEWNDILRKHGIIPEKPPSPTPFIEEAILKARELAHENRLEGKDLDELDELEDEEDDEFLNQYRQKRLAELSTIQQASVHNQVYHVQKADWSRDVTEASNKAYIFVLLTSSHDTNVESRVMIEIWRELAQRFGEVKFCQIRGDLCIEGYPDRNTPTILVYKDGDVKKQIVTLVGFKGVRTKAADIQTLLTEVGAVKPTDSRIQNRRDGDTAAEERTVNFGKSIRSSRTRDQDDSDSD